MFPFITNPQSIVQEMTTLNRRLTDGMTRLGRIAEEDIVIGATPKEAVYTNDGVVLYRYTPVVDEPFPVPLLLSYALVNRPYMVDLQENRSLVRNLLHAGIDVYLIDWGYPQRNDRYLTLDDYINEYIGGCVDYLRARSGLDKINLLGICEGGVFSLCYTALHPEKILNLITMVTPVDFSVEDGMLNRWSRRTAGGGMDVDLMVDALGNIPGDFMNFGFLMLKPFQLNVDKYVNMLDIMDDDAKLMNFMRMEKWIFDSPDQAGEAFRQFLTDFYQANKLVAGEVEINGARVDLGNITQPVLNIYAEADHLVPPAASKPLGDYLGTDDYTVASFPVGHIGMYVSGKVQRSLPPLIAEWLKARA